MKIFNGILLCLFILSTESFSQPAIYIASADWCGPCKSLKQRLSERNIGFIEFKLPVPQKDTFLVTLSKYVNGLPTLFIDLNGNRIFEQGEPYAAGSFSGEGLVDIYNGTHKTITLENYISFTTAGRELLSKMHNRKITGNLHGDNNTDSLNIGGIGYKVSIDIRQFYLNITYRTDNSGNPFTCTFHIEIKKNIPYDSFLREFSQPEDSLDTFIPEGVMQHLCGYLREMNNKLQ